MKRLMLRIATIKPVTNSPVPGTISPSNVPHVAQHPISILYRITSIPILYRTTKEYSRLGRQRLTHVVPLSLRYPDPSIDTVSRQAAPTGLD